MIKLGEIQTLQILKKVDFGVYLWDGEDKEERVLLPKKQLPEQAQVGDTVEVFIYRDSKDRLIATTGRPGVTLHRVARLRVAQVGKIGAFLDWGLEKDLLLPFREQTAKVRKGDEVLAALYVDKSGRLCATMKVYEKLREESLPGARQAVSMIVGRDTKALTEEGVIKAAVETVAENVSDGVIAPLFYLLFFTLYS